MRRLSTTALAILATVVTSTVALAQTRPAAPARPNRAGQPANRDSQPPGARRIAPRQAVGPMRGPASGLLRMREQLDLTDEQVKRLEALQLAPRPQRNESDALRARADLMDATKGDINLEKARAALDRMARVRTDEQLARLKEQQEVRNVLTVAQRARLEAFRGAGPRSRGVDRGVARGGRPGQVGPGMRGRRGPAGPPMGGQGIGPGIRQRGMGPGMGPQGVGPQGVGPQGMGQRGMGPQGMGPGMRQGPGMEPRVQPGLRRRMNVPPDARPPVPPADTLR